MMVKLLRWMRGQVTFQAEGAGVEKFFQLTAEQGVPMRQLRREQAKLIGITVPSRYKELANCAKRSGMRLRHSQKRGLPFLLHRYRKRWGLLIGACLFLAFLMVSQNFVWNIQIDGYGEKQEAYLRDVMADCGLHIGTYLPDTNLRSVRDQVLAQVDDLSWLTFTRTGTTIQVDFTPKTPQPIMDQNEPCNLVALKDGKILSSSVMRGQLAVQKNQVVHAGDLLISGIDQLPKGGMITVHARGEVMAETVNKKEISFAFRQTEQKFLKQSTDRKYLEFLGVKVPLFIAFDLPYQSQVEVQYEPATFFHTELPMGLRTEHHEFYEPVSKNYTEEEAKELICQAFSVYETEQLSHAEILGYTEEWNSDGEKMVCVRRYRCIENIAQEMVLSVNDSQKK